MKGYYNHETGLWSAVVTIAGFPVRLFAKSMTGLCKLIERVLKIK